jgi:hypothetical protein
VHCLPDIDVTATSPSDSITNDPAPFPASPPLDVTDTDHGSIGAVLVAAHESINIIVAIVESFMRVSAL